VPDPSAAPGDEEQRARAFWNVATMLKRRIDLMLALPLASLDRLALQREVRAIGTR
jgi:arsenate reductase